MKEELCQMFKIVLNTTCDQVGCDGTQQSLHILSSVSFFPVPENSVSSIHLYHDGVPQRLEGDGDCLWMRGEHMQLRLELPALVLGKARC